MSHGVGMLTEDERAAGALAGDGAGTPAGGGRSCADPTGPDQQRSPATISRHKSIDTPGAWPDTTAAQLK